MKNLLIPVEFIKHLVDNGRKRKYCLRSILDCILKVTRTWLPVAKDGTWSSILAHLVQKERLRQGRKACASRVAVDSQSVKIGTLTSLDTGIDVLGLPLALRVGSANIHDPEAGIKLIWQLDLASDRLGLICGFYASGFY